MAVIRKKIKSTVPLAQGAARPEDLRKFAADNQLSLLPLDVYGIAKYLGIHVTKEPLEDNVSGYLKQQGGSWIIAVNSLHHPRRQRFTVAHELAHFVLHRHQQGQFIDNVLFRDDERNPMESAANRFAGEMLVPEREFRAAVASGMTLIENLADHFGVSALAVRVRAKQLGFQGHGL